MAGNTMKDMTTNFGKLDKFEGHDFRRWQKKMHFLLTMLKVVYVLTTPMPKLVEDATMEAIRIRAKWENDDHICRGHILNGMSDSLFDVYTNVESAKELWDSLESKYMAEDASSKKFLVSNFNNYKMVDSRPIMEQFNELLRILGQYTQHGLKMDESIYVSSIIDKLPPSWKDFKHTLKHVKDDLSLVQLGSHLRIEESLRAQESDKGKGKEVGGPSVNMTEEVVLVPTRNQSWNVGSVARLVTSKGIVVVVDAIAWWIDSGATTHVCKDRCWFKIYEPVEDGSVLYMGDEHFAPVHGKGSVALEFSSGKTVTLFNVLYVPKLRIIHETTAPYTPQQNGVAERKNRALKEMVNSMLSYSGLSEGFWGEAMLTACYLLNRVPNKRNKTTPYELWYKKRPNLSYLRVWGCRAVVRLSDPKRKTLGEKGIDCIFVGYAEHSKAYRFYVIEPNESVSINSIIESRDAIFDENRFSSIPRPKDVIPNSVESQRDDHSDDVPKAIDDEIGSIMENNTWVLSDLPPGCKPLGCKWIFKRKMKVDGTIDKFKARLVIQGFRQKEGIDYFDTYALVARITTIRLLLALAAIHNLVIHQMDVKTIFLNGDLDEGYVMPDNEHKMCKLVKSLYGLKQAPKQWYQKFDEVVLSSGFHLNQSDKFSMKDMGEANVILGIKIKRENKGIVITQSHYIEKILNKFNHEDCSPVSTPIDPVEKLKQNCVRRVHLWASKKQTCITGSTMEFEFVALATTGKEAEWLRNLIHEIPICPKPIGSISIHCNSAATLVKAYSQMYNGKSRHLDRDSFGILFDLKT
ncbi:zinc finger, CCHC-type containing protein [Tanacetum coccineum]